MSNYRLNKSDYKAIETLDRFLPDKIFDAHMHLSLSSFAKNLGDGRKKSSTYESYFKDMRPYFKKREEIKLNIIIEPDICYKNEKYRLESISFLNKTLNEHQNCVGEIVIRPDDSKEKIESMLINDKIIGFKCYHFLSNKKNTWNLSIEEYLPESAWQVANDRNMCITLHMVKNDALADKSNMKYIITHAKKYPNAKLILAHAGRSFASWTGVENIFKLKKYQNIYFDISAICESPAIIQILLTIGSSRCMWGSDYSCNMLRGKAISLADSFYWIYDSDIKQFLSKTRVNSWLIGTENLMATRQACIITNATKRDINNIFYNTANNVFVSKNIK